MRKIYLLLTFLIAFATAQGQNESTQGDNVNKLKWIEGTWIITNPKPGHVSHEHWDKISSTELQGYSVTLKKTDTVFYEKMKIVILDKDLYFVADVAENKTPIFFKITKANETGFTCRNPEHDFPKEISYMLTGDKLKATISGNGKSIDFNYELRKPNSPR